jgi:CRP-like cAMP-binding protein
MDIIEFRLDKDQVLFREGEEGNFFYIVKTGKLELSIKGEKKKVFNDWDCFGELALLQKCKRTGTVKCLTDSKVYFIDGGIFRDLVQRLNNNRMKDRYSFIEMIPIIKNLNQVQKTSLAESINQVEFEDKEKIITCGDIGDNMYIVKEGIVSCKIKSREIRRLYTKDYFGQNALFTEGKRTLDVVSFGKCVCYEFTRETFKEALGESYKDIILHSIFMNHITNNKFFSDLFIESQFHNLYKLFELKSYKQNDVVYPQEQNKNKKIVLVIEGNIVNVRFTFIISLKLGIYLRQEANFMEKK